MCGITGFISREKYEILQKGLKKATDAISHRGPDDKGMWLDKEHNAGFGHTRLSIIDLSPLGRQPMKSHDGRAVIVYNGEIYNFKEIRKTLIEDGYVFKSNTDTEVVLNSYLKWGKNCLERFVGMFAFAIYDLTKKRLFIARDRVGIKPLYYSLGKNFFIFASELKSICAFDGFKREIDHDALSLFLHYQYIPAPYTIFKNVKKLEPGRFLEYDGDKTEIKSYWAHKVGIIDNIDENEALERLDGLLTKAVSQRMISDVPLGALLSGGIDSSMVVALMQKTSLAQVKTFSIGFNEKEYNEAPWAAKIAEHLGCDHTELYVSTDEAKNVIEKLPFIYDEPFADSSAIPTFLVSRLVKSEVTVALSGDGGDEQFAGYVRYWMTAMMAGRVSMMTDHKAEALARVLGRLPVSWVENCYLPLRSFLPQRFQVKNFKDKWQKLINLLGNCDLKELYRATVCLWDKDEIKKLFCGKILPDSCYEKSFEKSRGASHLSRLMYVDKNTYLPDAMLTKVDRASMACGLEVRVPLLDHRVMEYVAALPDNLKYRNGEGKYLLKKDLAKYIPASLFLRPKMGFGVPLENWLRTDLKELLMDYLSKQRLKKEGLFDVDFIHKTIKEHTQSKANHQHKLWAVLMWEMWREKWV